MYCSSPKPMPRAETTRPQIRMLAPLVEPAEEEGLAEARQLQRRLARERAGRRRKERGGRGRRGSRAGGGTSWDMASDSLSGEAGGGLVAQARRSGRIKEAGRRLRRARSALHGRGFHAARAHGVQPGWKRTRCVRSCRIPTLLLRKESRPASAGTRRSRRCCEPRVPMSEAPKNRVALPRWVEGVFALVRARHASARTSSAPAGVSSASR